MTKATREKQTPRNSRYSVPAENRREQTIPKLRTTKLQHSSKSTRCLYLLFFPLFLSPCAPCTTHHESAACLYLPPYSACASNHLIFRFGRISVVLDSALIHSFCQLLL